MNSPNIAKEIELILGVKPKVNEPMKNYTSLKIGGKADLIVEVESIPELKSLLLYLKKKNIPYFILGNGTNLLIKDEGIREVVIKLGSAFNRIYIDGEELTSMASSSLSRILEESIMANLTGLEFLVGIPGSLGGALVMNAGVKERCIGDVVDWVRILTSDLEELTLSSRDIDFFYRGSSLKSTIILEAKFTLKRSSKEEILEKLNYFQRERTLIKLPNAGSIFKNPLRYFAGELIEKVGLKGYRIGDAQISPVHANFIQNLGNAKAKDVLLLIEKIRKAVLENFGVNLELEIEVVGGS
jgi:UDP-N-acetylmuramate dehydrogenase